MTDTLDNCNCTVPMHGGRPHSSYYVTIRDAGRDLLAAGPYPTHRDALDRVDRVNRWVSEHDERGYFYLFGTASHPTASAPVSYFTKHGITV